MHAPDSYHSRTAFWASQSWHSGYLRRCYAWALARVLTEPTAPLHAPGAKVLLCGTGSARTTRTFLDTLAKHGLRPEVYVLDIAEEALERSRAVVREDERVSFLLADARQLPLPDASFALVETDFLLQLIPPGDRSAVVRDWARVLAPGGAVTTRDWIHEDVKPTMLERGTDALRLAMLRRALGVPVHALARTEVEALFAEAGLRMELHPLRLPGTVVRLPLLKAVLGWR
ncbi:class I SAM-dependent methyltransferase [Archangium lansingense]|uniref:Class I SAM-dependent methyltransferase n=1 Tax=Archangium lansingense TaxID=2995310 RepID=A0ABT4A8S8_9BACT|nr:class I SAM-dependent methyltransferase [Archangium lansinium]MCY1078059.1 class I SAM-dependent methyltransferase [Archangium lansinium]